MRKLIFIVLIMLASGSPLLGQSLYDAASQEVVLENGLSIQLHQKSNPDHFFYEPIQLRFATSRKGEPAYSLLSYKDGNETVVIFHFLLTWGLTQDQMTAVQDTLVQQQGKTVQLMGAMMPAWETAAVPRIEGSSSLAKALQNAKVQMGKLPLTPNTQMAASFQMRGADAEAFQKAWGERSPTLREVTIVLPYTLHYKDGTRGVAYESAHLLKRNFYQLIH
ncbi:MAG: hypothetical protein AAGF77_00030 [Bacteroidota bacterium]